MTVKEFGDQIGDIIYDNLGWCVVGIIGLIVVFVVLLGAAISKERAAFMDECLQHRPQYECTAMWRAGNQAGGYVQPVIIPMTR